MQVVLPAVEELAHLLVRGAGRVDAGEGAVAVVAGEPADLLGQGLVAAGEVEQHFGGGGQPGGEVGEVGGGDPAAGDLVGE